MRSGIGFDIHRLEEGRPLRLGGVDIPDADRGPVAHSDGDALIHALCDALLGALALGDIGTHFPDTDPEWQDADSVDLLRRVAGLIAEHGHRPNNVDCMLILERPKIGPYREQMRLTMAEALGMPVERVSVKATTHEKLGPLGAAEGVAAYAVATLVPIP